MPSPPPTFFATAADFRAWLQAHGGRAAELVVGFWKVESGRPSMRWPESVDEALCFGWIDGVRKRIDDEAYLIRFTPRRPASIWSAVNIAKVESLIAAGRMQPAGLAAYAVRLERKSAVYAYEQREHPQLSAAETRAFRRAKAAWRFFEACPPSYRKPILYWVVSAKKPETRQRRLDQLIEACARQQRLLK
ncbi:MAG: YdeI/OmpD-associated family protein [Rubrivivax sp.]